jgi:signal transduction histidine kinase
MDAQYCVTGRKIMNISIHVLVVDSDIDFSTRICQILDQATEYEYQVSVCHLGEEAIVSCRWKKYDCVLIDSTMPDMSGARVVEARRALRDEETSPIIMMASERIREAATEAVKLQAADFFVKSDINHHSIRRSVGNAIEKGQLQRGIRERRRELMLANRELERQAVEIQRLYHTVSHEIKTPLAAAREFVSIVHDGLLGPINAEQSEVLEHATLCCDQITTQFNDLVDLTRLETGKLALDITATHLGDIVKRALAMAASSAEEKSILLDSRIPESLPMVDVDAGSLFTFELAPSKMGEIGKVA